MRIECQAPLWFGDRLGERWRLDWFGGQCAKLLHHPAHRGTVLTLEFNWWVHLTGASLLRTLCWHHWQIATRINWSMPKWPLHSLGGFVQMIRFTQHCQNSKSAHREQVRLVLFTNYVTMRIIDYLNLFILFLLKCHFCLIFYALENSFTDY